MDSGREHVSSCRMGVTRLVVSCPAGNRTAPTASPCEVAVLPDAPEKVRGDSGPGICVDPGMPIDALRGLLEGLEGEGHRHAEITVDRPLTQDVLDTLCRVSRAAALNARSLRSIRIETSDVRDFERLRLSLGLPVQRL